MDEVFGEVLPTVTTDETSDERESQWPSPDNDSWYERNRPPHHDRP
jgi:hypothetical protein